MNKKELKNNEKTLGTTQNIINKTTSKNCSTLISNHQPLISDHKAITLIALVITIIIMLILVGVTVVIALNGGLFNTTKEAAKGTQFDADRESLLAAVLGSIDRKSKVDYGELEKHLPEGFEGNKEDGYTSKSGNTFYVDEYGNITTEKKDGGSNQGGAEPSGGGTTPSEKWELAEDGNTASKGEVTVKIGDYVNYTPVPETTTYSKEKLDENYTGSTSNTSDLTTQTELKWRILGVDENGCLTIISDKPTNNDVYFNGAKGYNNGVYILNDICKTLYSSTELGVYARSLTIEDVEAGFSQEGIEERNSCTNDGIQYNQPKTYTGSNAQYPALYAEENGSGIGVKEANKNTGRKTDGIGGSEAFYNEVQLTQKPDSKESDSEENLTCTETYYYFRRIPATYCKNSKFYEMIFSTSTYYWLASRCVRCDSSVAYFGLRYVYDEDYAFLEGNSMFYSDGGAEDGYLYLRPTVSLGSNIKLTLCNGDNSAENPHKLSKASS